MNQEISFVATLPATPRGARLARQMAVAQLAERKLPFEDAAQVVAELAGNAVTHGRVRGRGFRLAMGMRPGPTLRIEVTDTRSEALPSTVVAVPDVGEESGRGLCLVSALAARWGTDRGLPPLKTVWAEIDLACPISPDRGFRDPVDRVPVRRDA
ncbi:ATP-binding protein [Streptomyces bambusae]|uniref:ATP-binding protein n=1 Tax=Streptomyces bambusae TaxID=1550616 RepID=A0ABS6YZX9_9ACTN|nr:ATP-binding protein [Streptomyces bambusae]MBW5481034.1 ATP-binding protein [Streptomyces bambusae]